MEYLINVFNDTEKIAQNFSDSITEKFTFDDIIKPTTDFKNNISVIPTDTVSAIESSSGKICAINMASYKRPGGGVRNGARAQEEGLFRCSNLINVISTDFYPLNQDECLYTKDAVFFKNNNYELITPIKSDVITIAAVNLNGLSMPDNYKKIVENKMRLMCSVPSLYKTSNLILGAWGCGVFKNDPEYISKTFRKILVDEGYASLYDSVIFAVINDRNSVANNYEIFSKNLK